MSLSPLTLLAQIGMLGQLWQLDIGKAGLLFLPIYQGQFINIYRIKLLCVCVSESELNICTFACRFVCICMCMSEFVSMYVHSCVFEGYRLPKPPSRIAQPSAASHNLTNVLWAAQGVSAQPQLTPDSTEHVNWPNTHTHDM